MPIPSHRPPSAPTFGLPRAAALCLCALLAPGCGGGDDADSEGAADAGAQAADAGSAADAGEVCDPATHRVNLPGPFTCAGEPAFVTVQGDTHAYDVFTYEASHPLATEALAFPCAASLGEGFEAPVAPTQACSKAGVRPWHSVRWADAEAACAETGDGWRLCTREELTRACAGPEGNTFTWGPSFEAGACNVRNAYTAPGAGTTSEAPAGAFEDCHSSEGVYDADGNLWEWVSDRDALDEKVRYYLGAGWMVNGARYMEGDQACATETKVPRASAPSYSTGFVGFRCCRDH